ncbi:MAG: signal recognition particle-docking protein FtsY, partial [Verrucomicrobiales bacterium]|nr:signal recognition particle-docking protein FtsY [Verrucomicrobiales bacterium]
MGLLDKFKAGLARTKEKLSHEIKRIVTRSPKLDADALEELEATLIAADLGMDMTTRIVEAVRVAYESQGSEGLDVLGIARQEIEQSLGEGEAIRRNGGLTVVSVVGVNGTGKTTTCAKLAHR